LSSTNIKTSLRYPPLTEPSQAFRSIDKMVTLETHTLHERNVEVAQRCSVILIYQVLTLLDAKLATASQKSWKLSGRVLPFSIFESHTIVHTTAIQDHGMVQHAAIPLCRLVQAYQEASQ
jgi:hypothetical protein